MWDLGIFVILTFIQISLLYGDQLCITVNEAVHIWFVNSLVNIFVFLTVKWMKKFPPTQMTGLTVVPLTPLSNTLHPFCFPSCECGRHWSVEAYNDARRNPRARALDENLFGVSECQVPSHPVLLHCPSCLCFCCLRVALARDRESSLLLCIDATTSKLHSECVCFLNCFICTLAQGFDFHLCLACTMTSYSLLISLYDRVRDLWCSTGLQCP